MWHKYAEGVPSLPPAPPGYVWEYDQSEALPTYYFTNLDKASRAVADPGRSN